MIPACGQRGFALVIVLWAGVFLSVIAASFAFSMRVESSLATNLLERAEAEALAEAGIQRGILALLPASGVMPWRADGRTYEMAFGGGTVRMRIRSESGKVDLNAAPAALVEGLFASLAASGAELDESEARRLAGAILDWRDPDDRRSDWGAEDRDYRAAGKPFGARDGAFLSVAELDQVLGMRPDIYARLRESVTVHSWMPQVDAGTASRDVLLAVPGLDAGAVDRFLAEREATYAAATEDDAQRVRPPLEILAPGARYLSRARARVYTVEAEGEAPGGVRARRKAVVRLTGNPEKPYSVVAWFDTVYESTATQEAR